MSHAIKVENYGSVVIAYPDTDTFVSLLQHFCKLKYFNLEVVSSRGNFRTFFPIHELANDLRSDLVRSLPAIHALSGCDTSSKIGTKCRAVMEGASCYHLLEAFGRDALSDKMIVMLRVSTKMYSKA